MACNTPPEVPCGNTLPDTCIIFTGEINSCFEYTGPCISRQSQFNDFVQTNFCEVKEALVTIAEAINFGAIAVPSCWVGPWVPPVNIQLAIDPIWAYICTNQGMGTPITGVDPKCLVDPCEPPITTLGPLLQALVDEVCDAAGTVAVYRANLTQTGTAAPVVTVLEALKINGVVVPIVWTRTGAGSYNGTVASATFTANKTFLMMNNVNASVISFSRTSTTVVNIGTPLDNTLVETSVEIRIYS